MGEITRLTERLREQSKCWGSRSVSSARGENSGWAPRSRYLVIALLVEHATDVLSKYEVGTSGRTGHEVLMGKPYSHGPWYLGNRSIVHSQMARAATKKC